MGWNIRPNVEQGSQDGGIWTTPWNHYNNPWCIQKHIWERLQDLTSENSFKLTIKSSGTFASVIWWEGFLLKTAPYTDLLSFTAFLQMQSVIFSSLKIFIPKEMNRIFFKSVENHVRLQEMKTRVLSVAT